MEDQISQAEELPTMKPGKSGTPAVQPPAKGAKKRKGKTPRHKIPGYKMWAILTGRGNRHMRQEERDAW